MAEGKPWQEKHCPPGRSRSGGERARGQRWAEQSSSPHGSPEPSCFSEALFRPSPGARAFQAAPKLPPRHRLPQCPSPGKEGEWLGGGGSPTSWATRLEMRTARLTRPFWALGCRAPVPLAFPAGAAMEDLAPPSLSALEPEGLASAPPAPQQQSQPRLRPRGWRPGAQGRLWHEARVAGAGPRGWGHPGSECGQQPAWLGPPMAPPGAGPPAANVLRPARPPAQQQLRGRNLGSSAGPSSQAPTPTPATLGSPALPGLASGPLPRGPIRAPAAAAPAARAPPPPPGSQVCHRRLMVSPTPPPLRSSAQPARLRPTPRDGETAR